MYNKPITQRVAFARGKKASALKQTTPKGRGESKDVSVKSKKVEPGAERTEIVETAPTEKYEGEVATGEAAEKWAKQKEYCKGKPKGTPGCSGFHKFEGGGTEEITTKDPDKIVETEDPVFNIKKGDALHTWQQRSVERGLSQSARKTGKFAGKLAKDQKRMADLEKRGKTDSPKYAKLKARVEARQKALDAQKNFAQTQRDMATQGITPGSRGKGDISTYDPRDYDYQMTEAEMGYEEQVKRLKEKNAKDNIDESNANQNAVKRQASQDTANQTAAVTSDIITPDSGALFEDLQSPRTVAAMKKKSPLAMKSSFKMGGFGSKTYKK